MATPTKPTTTPPIDMRAAVSINPDIITEEYVQFPNTLKRCIDARVDATMVHRLVELDAEVDEEKIRLEVVAANAQALADAEKTGEKVKKLTEDDKKALVLTDPRYRASREKVIRAARDKEAASGLVEAAQAKQQMLISLGATMRLERDGDISIKDRSRRQ